jgi:hypothetical protein
MTSASGKSCDEFLRLRMFLKALQLPSSGFIPLEVGILLPDLYKGFQPCIPKTLTLKKENCNVCRYVTKFSTFIVTYSRKPRSYTRIKTS